MVAEMLRRCAYHLVITCLGILFFATAVTVTRCVAYLYTTLSGKDLYTAILEILA